MSTEVCTSLGPSAALDIANSSTSNVAPEVKYDVACPSPASDINSSPTITPDCLANLTPLPTQSPNEIQDLDPTYPNYRATIHYYSLSPSGTLTQETHPKPVSRTSVLLSLEYFYALRKHLTASLSILDTYPGTSLAAVQDTATRHSSSLTALERAQNEFAMHHIAINENLRAVNSNWGCHAFGLPDPMAAASDVRRDRNYFAHTFPTPTGKGIQLEWAVKGKRDVYGRLLELVERNIGALEEQLGGERGWVSPQVVERENAERRRLEAEAENERRTEMEAQEGDCVSEQEDDVEGMAPPRSVFSRVFDSFGGNVVLSRCFRYGIVRRAGWRLLGWLGGVLAEADTVARIRAHEEVTGEYENGQLLAEAGTTAQVRGEEGVPGECGEGDNWGSQEDEIGDDDCRSQEYKAEYDEGFGCQDIGAHLPHPDSGWGDPQW